MWKNIANTKKDINTVNLDLSDVFSDQALRIGEGNHWRCLLAVDGIYRVGDIRRTIDFNPNINGDPKVVWCKEIPIKVICFIWRASLDRIPTAEALAVRGVLSGPTSCVRCSGTDSTNHILVTCPFATLIRSWITNWCGVDLSHVANVDEVLLLVKSWGRCPKLKRILTSICYGMLWSLWKARNNRVFNKRIVSASSVFDEILSSVFFWLKHRGNLGIGDWVNWCIFPFSLTAL